MDYEIKSGLWLLVNILAWGFFMMFPQDMFIYIFGKPENSLVVLLLVIDKCLASMWFHVFSYKFAFKK